MSAATLPMIIQGGMGVAISDWRLAHTVAQAGQLGVISGTGIDTVLVRRLQDGDPGGHMRRALAAFPIPAIAEDALQRYFLPEGRKPGESYAMIPMYRKAANPFRERLAILSAFVEVYLAKAGHAGVVGINLLTKVQMPNLPLLYGAMLAGVDVVLMGAGIPLEIPAALDALAEHKLATMRFDVENLPAGEEAHLALNPASLWDGPPPALRRPYFLPIIASNSLAMMLVRRAKGRVDGFVVEGPTAGGHNAPPRNSGEFNERGEPVYGPRDVVDLVKLRDLGLPFWLAGGVGSPEGLQRALDAGANGIQVGTLFAYCAESGMEDGLRQSVLEAVLRGEVRVRTDPLASPTGFPFKVVTWLNAPGEEGHRERVCDLGYLRTPYINEKGELAYRCASEPIDAYVRKGGELAATEGRQCLCNALMANIGFGQERKGHVEPPLITSGDDLVTMGGFLNGRTRYSAAEVIAYLRGNAG
ncbi:MAG: nitronate monooxygenase [Oscillochloris sp.]|nr:nitronate monooxygenase [Oscillochloris sp.]